MHTLKFTIYITTYLIFHVDTYIKSTTSTTDANECNLSIKSCGFAWWHLCVPVGGPPREATADGLGWLAKKIEGKKPPLFLPQLPKQTQLPKREASTNCLADASSSTLGLKTPYWSSYAQFGSLLK